MSPWTKTDRDPCLWGVSILGTLSETCGFQKIKCSSMISDSITTSSRMPSTNAAFWVRLTREDIQQMVLWWNYNIHTEQRRCLRSQNFFLKVNKGSQHKNRLGTNVKTVSFPWRRGQRQERASASTWRCQYRAGWCSAHITVPLRTHSISAAQHEPRQGIIEFPLLSMKSHLPFAGILIIRTKTLLATGVVANRGEPSDRDGPPTNMVEILPGLPSASLKMWRKGGFRECCFVGTDGLSPLQGTPDLITGQKSRARDEGAI